METSLNSLQAITMHNRSRLQPKNVAIFLMTDDDYDLHVCFETAILCHIGN